MSAGNTIPNIEGLPPGVSLRPVGGSSQDVQDLPPGVTLRPLSPPASPATSVNPQPEQGWFRRALGWTLGTIGPDAAQYQHQGAIESTARGLESARQGMEETDIQRAATTGERPGLLREVGEVALGSTAGAVRTIGSPKSTGQVIAATAIPATRLPLGLYNVGVGAYNALRPQQEGESNADYAARIAGSTGQAILGGTLATSGAPAFVRTARNVARAATGIRPAQAVKTATQSMGKFAAEASKVQEANTTAQTKYAGAVRQVARKQATVNTETEAANQAAAADHAAQTQRVNELNRAGQEAVGRRAELSSKITSDSTALGRDLNTLENRVRLEGRAKYAAVDKALEGETVPAEKLAPSVRVAQEQMLKGSPESIKQFNDILQKGEAAPVETSAGTATPGTPLYNALVQQGAIEPTAQLGFNDLQGYYTELGQKMQGENVPGDVYRALKFVRQQIGNQMDLMAAKKGVSADLDVAKAHWRQYEQTFHDMRAVARGGSPVARAIRAQDPGYVAAPLLGKGSARSVDMISKYSPEIAGRMGRLASDYQQMTSLPRKFTPKEVPEAPTLKSPKQVTAPEPPVAKPLPEAPDLMRDIKVGREKSLGSLSEGLQRPSHWDFAAIASSPFTKGLSLAVPLLRRGIGKILDNPTVRESLTNPTPEDFAALRKLPTTQQAEAQDAVTQVYTKQATQGQLRGIPPQVRQFLRPEQVDQINAAVPSAALGTPRPVMGIPHAFDYPILRGGEPIGTARVVRVGDELHIGSVAPTNYTPGMEPMSLGADAVRSMRQQLETENPGTRVRWNPRSASHERQAARVERRQGTQLAMPQPPAALPPRGGTVTASATASAVSGADKRASIARVMQQLKSGEITQARADSIIQRLTGGGGRKLIRIPPPP